MEIRALLLCGGASRRFGSNKLLMAIPGEEERGSIVARAAVNLREGAGGTPLALVPLGANRLREALEGVGCEVVESDRTQRGMGASLAAAVAASDRADGWIVALGDMPLVTPATIRALRDLLAEGALLAAPVARASGARGHPVAFSAALRAELLALDGDVGARGIVERHRDELRILPTEDPGIVIDLDTPAQLSALAAERRRSDRS
jgi:molybdenum cofactor cytidylyltransferase